MESPHTGLVLPYPCFVLERPSGAWRPRWQTPDTKLAEDPLNPGAAINVQFEMK